MPTLNITNSQDTQGAATQAAPTPDAQVTPTQGDPGENVKPTLNVTKSTDEKPEEGTLVDDVFTYKGQTFDLSTDEGRAKLLRFMAESVGDNELVDALQDYIRKHHPGEDVGKIIGSEIINTILAGFLSGRTATGGAGPLTAQDTPPAIDISIDESTAEYLLRAANTLAAGTFHFILNAINSFLASFTDWLPRLPGSLTNEDKEKLKRGYLVPVDSFWGRLSPELQKWVGYREVGDGTAYIGGQTTAGQVGEFTGDAIALIVGPGKIKQGVRAVVKSALSKLPKNNRSAIVRALTDARQKKLGMTKSTVPMSKAVVDDILKSASTLQKTGLRAAVVGSGVTTGAVKLSGKFAPLAAEWVAAEQLARAAFNKYGTELSPENREKWITWFAFNYVWADITVQLIDKAMQVLWSIQGSQRKDVKTIGGTIIKVMAAEILTGAQIIAGIGITKIQSGEISPEEFIRGIVNANLDVLGLDKPVSINDVLKALGGVTEGTDFDVITYEGKQYTVQPKENLIVDDQGKKIPRGSALGNKIWAAWEATVEGKGAGEQTIHQNSGGYVRSHYNRGGYVMSPRHPSNNKILGGY